MKALVRSRGVSLGVVGVAICIGYVVMFMDVTAQPRPVAASKVEVDTSGAAPVYANFSRVTGTPEELIFDFGMNAQPFGVPAKPLKIDHQVVMNYYTAKRLMQALQESIARHEAAFGPIETDVTKRVKTAPASK